jgi:hypothetical protein
MLLNWVSPCYSVSEACVSLHVCRCDPYTNWLLTGQDMNVCW